MRNRIWPFRHFGLKLLSVAIALVLWMNVAGEETVERGLRAPLELQQFPAGLEIQGEPPSTVDVRVRGTSGALSRVGAGDIVGALDHRADVRELTQPRSAGRAVDRGHACARLCRAREADGLPGAP